MNEDKIKKKLKPEEYEVLRKGGTEVPFTGKFLDNKEKGTYKCKVCGGALFSSDTKFDSQTGWPSFTDVISNQNVITKEDTSHGINRVEVLCKNCGSHLGHVFPDGPEDRGGKRYCINSVCLEFEPEQNNKT